MNRRLVYVLITVLVLIGLIAGALVIRQMRVATRPSPIGLRPTPTSGAVSSVPSPEATLDVPSPNPSPTLTPSLSPGSPPTSPGAARATASPSPSNIGQESLPIIYDQSGQGNGTTPNFQVPSQWLTYWSYRCADGSQAANALRIDVYLRSVDQELKSFSNDMGRTEGMERTFVGDNWYHLSVHSACQWRVTVTPAPGQSMPASPSPSP